MSNVNSKTKVTIKAMVQAFICYSINAFILITDLIGVLVVAGLVGLLFAIHYFFILKTGSPVIKFENTKY